MEVMYYEPREIKRFSFETYYASEVLERPEREIYNRYLLSLFL